MKRRVILLLLLLVAGAIVNVAVAFAFNSPGFPLRSIRGLPYRPIWPGFLINTVLYAFVLCLLFAAPFALRRHRRIKRGLCLKCGYNLRNRPSDSSVCPECGELT